ncbi:STAS domain-containing protein [Streptomyces sp. NPDC006368]|uniref:STAS domain-containing protein n=1 Tax=Streptomyces sp. NPDC006368 TaxID=3156760 RepID=UPI0033AF5B41
MLNLTTASTPDGAVLRVDGDLDFHTVPRFRETLAAVALTAGQRFVLDLANLAFCDSSGITAFLVARNHAAAAGAELALVGVPEHTWRVLRLVGLDEILGLEPGRATTDSA